MALVVTRSDDQRIQGLSGDKRRVSGTIAFDASYPTGGESLLNSQLGLDTVTSISVFPTNGFVFQYRPDPTFTVRVYRSGTADAVLNEVTAATDLSSLTAVPFEAFGS